MLVTLLRHWTVCAAHQGKNIDHVRSFGILGWNPALGLEMVPRIAVDAAVQAYLYLHSNVDAPCSLRTLSVVTYA